MKFKIPQKKGISCTLVRKYIRIKRQIIGMFPAKKQTKIHSTLYTPALLSHSGTCLFEGLFPSAHQGHFRWRLQIPKRQQLQIKKGICSDFRALISLNKRRLNEMLHFLLSSPSRGLIECKQSPPFCVLQASQALVAPSLNKAWKHPESIEIDGKLPGGRSRQDRLLFSSSGGWQVTTTGL